MRRRQIFAMQSNALNHTEERIHEEAKRQDARQAPAEEVLIAHPKATVCPTCGKIVGRGMAMHQRHCKGL